MRYTIFILIGIITFFLTLSLFLRRRGSLHSLAMRNMILALANEDEFNAYRSFMISAQYSSGVWHNNGMLQLATSSYEELLQEVSQQSDLSFNRSKVSDFFCRLGEVSEMLVDQDAKNHQLTSPSHFNLLLFASGMYVQSGHTDLAQKQADALLDMPCQDPLQTYYLSRLLLQLGQYANSLQKAREACAKLSKISPGLTQKKRYYENQLLLGLFCLRMENLLGNDAHFLKLSLAISDTTRDAYLSEHMREAVVDCWCKAGGYTNAIMLIAAWARTQPKYHLYLTYLPASLHLQELDDKCLYQKMVEQHPLFSSHKPIENNSAEMEALRLLFSARASYVRQDMPSLGNYLRDILKVIDKVKINQHLFYKSIADLYCLSGKFPQAKLYYEKILRCMDGLFNTYPPFQNAPIFYTHEAASSLSYVYVQLGDYASAKDTWNIACKIEPNNINSFISYCIACQLEELHNKKTSLNLIQTYRALWQRIAQKEAKISEAYGIFNNDLAQKLSKTQKYLEDLLQELPNRLEVRFELARLAALRGDREKAQELLVDITSRSQEMHACDRGPFRTFALLLGVHLASAQLKPSELRRPEDIILTQQMLSTKAEMAPAEEAH